MASEKVMGMDPSLSSFGVAYRLPDGSIGASAIRGGKRGVQHQISIVKSVLLYVDLHGPNVVAMEGYAFGAMRGHTQAIFDIAELCGVLRIALLRRGIDVVTVPPATMKKIITGKGNAKKETVQECLTRDHGMQFKYSDQYDAAGLLLVGEAYVSRVRFSRNRQNEMRQLLSGCAIVTASEIDCNFV